MNHPEQYVKYYTVDERITGALSALSGNNFAIVNETDNKAFYCESGQFLGYGNFKDAFDISNEGYLFKISRISGGRSLKLVTPDGEEYQMSNTIAYLNSQAADGNCCFINVLKTGMRGYEITDGAVWDLQYEEGKGWSMKNVGTGKYLKDASHPAKFDEPTYFTFCTLKETDTAPTGIADVRGKKDDVRSGAYTLDGRKVNADDLRPGLYIINGKKVVVNDK
jgi:hypothetical protein